MRKNKIPDGRYRIIKISKEALFEFLYESINDNQEAYFGVSDATTIVKRFAIDWETDEFICVARNELGEKERLQFPNIDTDVLLSKLKDTTSTMFTDNRYIELNTDEINDIQNGLSNKYTK